MAADSDRGDHDVGELEDVTSIASPEGKPQFLDSSEADHAQLQSPEHDVASVGSYEPPNIDVILAKGGKGDAVKPPWTWSLLSTLLVLQSFVGWFSCMIAWFLIVRGDIERGISLTVLGAGVVLLLVSFAGFLSVRKQKFLQGLTCLLTAMGVEIGELLYFLKVVSTLRNWSLFVGAVHAIGIVVTLLAGLWIRRARTKADAMKQEGAEAVRNLFNTRKLGHFMVLENATLKISNAVRCEASSVPCCCCSCCCCCC